MPVRIMFTLFNCCILLTYLLSVPNPSAAEWSVQGESYLFYTDDAALFSSSRRLARDQDPTQPVVDRPLAEQGEDVVYEPVVQINKSFGSPGRQTEIALRSQGFVFADQGRFNHATVGVQILQELSSTTKLGGRYFFGPDLFLGKNELRTAEESAEEEFHDEEVTTHFWAAGLSQEVHEDVTAIFYGRYGLRRYNDSFDQRDTDFWTIGSHVEWEVCDHIEFALAYHYERGLAEGRHRSLLKDDISYFNHFVSGELLISLVENLTLELLFDYERNTFTTGIVGDERNGQHEDVVSGDVALVYELGEAAELTAGFQGTHRKESFETGLHNLNAWFGGRIEF